MATTNNDPKQAGFICGDCDTPYATEHEADQCCKPMYGDEPDDLHEGLDSLLTAITSGNAINMESAFKELTSSKLLSALEERKPIVFDAMFDENGNYQRESVDYNSSSDRLTNSMANAIGIAHKLHQRKANASGFPIWKKGDDFLVQQRLANISDSGWEHVATRYPQHTEVHKKDAVYKGFGESADHEVIGRDPFGREDILKKKVGAGECDWCGQEGDMSNYGTHQDGIHTRPSFAKGKFCSKDCFNAYHDIDDPDAYDIHEGRNWPRKAHSVTADIEDAGYTYQKTKGGFHVFTNPDGDVIRHKFPTLMGNHSFTHFGPNGQKVWNSPNTSDTYIKQHMKSVKKPSQGSPVDPPVDLKVRDPRMGVRS